MIALTVSEAKDFPVVQILEARLRHGLGEKEKAEEMFRKLAEQLKETPAAWAEKLIETEMRLGLRELAFEHAAKSLDGFLVSSPKREGEAPAEPSSAAARQEPRPPGEPQRA